MTEHARSARAYLPPALRRADRVWGFGLNLYALRSARNWGIGDFSDLRDMIALAARLGAGIIGVNPLHALHWRDPEIASPYAPTSRFFLNPLYVDVEAVPEFAGDAAARVLVASPGFQKDLAEAKEAPLIRYDLVGACKRRVLELLYTAFRRDASVERRRAFGRFLMRGGSRLRRFAIHEALDARIEPEPLAAVLGEKLGVDHAVPRHAERHVPIAAHLPECRVVGVIGLQDLHEVVGCLREPRIHGLAGLAKDRFAAQFVELQDELGIVVVGIVFWHRRRLDWYRVSRV